MATTYKKKCGRCNGTGFFSRGFCFRCQGATTVTITRYTAAEKAERARYAARHAAAYDAIVRTRHTWLAPQDRVHLYGAFDLLEMRDPDRFAKMLDSLDAGRLHDVINALVAYYNANAN